MMASGIEKVAKLKDPDGFDVKSAIRRADILRLSYPDTAVLALYQGNGRFGCSYGPMGLHLNPEKSPQLLKYGYTHFLHIRHFVRAQFGADYLLPLFCIFWENEPESITGYKQLQSFYDGTISTYFEEGSSNVTVTTWFDPYERDVAGIKIRVEGKASDIIISPFEKMHIHYGQEAEQKSEISFGSGLWKVDLSCLNAKSAIYIKTNTTVKVDGSHLRINLHEGENTILLSVNNMPGSSSDESLSRTVGWWHSKWEEMGCLNFPDNDAQKMWVRTVAYILYSHNNDKMGTAPPMGLSGNGWPMTFPQELSFLQPVLHATGNFDISKSWIEYWAERIPGMRDYTKRIFGVEGVFCPWAMPFGDFEGYHVPSAPRKTYYEIHNSGYLARMAYETAIFLNDQDWTKKYAFPIIKETALFYKNICRKEEDGLWHIYVIPSMGQDEMGRADQKDYLCALFSAQYCFQKAIEYGLDVDGFYKQVLSDGLAFSSLMSENGYYYPHHKGDEDNPGKQKHPVQLNDLAYLPVNSHITTPSASAYNQRYNLTINASKPHFAGWTLTEFLLAGSRMGNAEEWKKDWDNLIKADLADKDLIQIFESSGNNRAFYITSSGMLAQSLLNNVVTDWFGKLEIGRCIPWQGKIGFKDIYTLPGVQVSGEIENGHADLSLKAWKNCKFGLYGKKIKMRKGEVKLIHSNLNED
jgi:hypothetical protein